MGPQQLVVQTFGNSPVPEGTLQEYQPSGEAMTL